MTLDQHPEEFPGPRTDTDHIMDRVKDVAKTITGRVKDALRDTDYDAEVVNTHDTRELPPLPGK